MTAAAGRRTALEQLRIIVDMYERGMREPVPLACQTSAAYAQAVFDGEDEDGTVAAARDAWQDWHRWPWTERAGVFLRAAALVAGPYRERLVAATMLDQSKTVSEAEADAACELADFLRWNVANLRRVLEIVLVINTITAFAFMFTYIYTITNGGPGYDTYVSEYYIWNQAFTNQNMGYAAAIGVMLVAMVLVVGMVQIRVLTRRSD